MMYCCLSSKKISCHVTYLFINACVLILLIMAKIHLLMASWYGQTGCIFIALMVPKILCHSVLRLRSNKCLGATQLFILCHMLVHIVFIHWQV